MSQSIYHVIVGPHVTEKANVMREEDNTYVLRVAQDANKVEIRNAVEKIFGVRVVAVRTSVQRGKVKRMRYGHGKKPNWKKAVVTLAEGDSIPLFEGV